MAQVNTGTFATVGSTTGSPIITSYTGNGTNGTNGTVYDVYRFTGSGSINFATAGLADVLCVGGGGSGWAGGSTDTGGGAGGMVYKNNFYLNSGSYTVTVGAGGAINSYPGATSNIDSIYAIGGGYGAVTGSNNRGGFGGSGGGGVNILAGTYVPGQGNAGSDGSSGGYANGGGAGGTATTGVTGPAGPGLANLITGSSVTYAAGALATAGAGTTNAGNGGGRSAAGGSGIVVIRVARN
jgi:hypothetical protein